MIRSLTGAQRAEISNSADVNSIGVMTMGILMMAAALAGIVKISEVYYVEGRKSERKGKTEPPQTESNSSNTLTHSRSSNTLIASTAHMGQLASLFDNRNW